MFWRKSSWKESLHLARFLRGEQGGHFTVLPVVWRAGALCCEFSAAHAGHGQVGGCAKLQGRLSATACTKNNCKSHLVGVPRGIHCRKNKTTEKIPRQSVDQEKQPLPPQRVGKPPRWVPPRPPLKPPRSPRKLVLFLSLPLSPRPAEVPPLPPPLGAPPPRSDLDLGGGDLGRSLSISSVQPVRWELGAVKYEEYVSALKLLFVRVGPTVSQPGNKTTVSRSNNELQASRPLLSFSQEMNTQVTGRDTYLHITCT